MREDPPVTSATKHIWDRIADRLKELGLSPKPGDNLPQWLSGEVVNARDPKGLHCEKRDRSAPGWHV